MSFLLSFSIFFLSFFPLWISIIFVDLKSILESSQDIYTEKISLLVLIMTLVISFIILKTALNTKSKDFTKPYIIDAAKEEKTITSEFLLSYILPLFTFDFTVWYEVILFLIFFLTFAFLCVKHNHFSVNIILEVMQYKFYSCELINEDSITIRKIVISKETLSAKINDTIYISSINNEYCIQVQNKD